jgi:uncharacterized protein (DUF1501 family)
MYLIDPAKLARRAFLKRAGALTLSGTALPFALNLAAMGEACAFDATDYKALVCVFLYGGSDYANTVVTYDTPSYNLYDAVRGASNGGISIAQGDLAATVLTPTIALPNGRQYALNPAMTGMANLFNTGKAAVQLNVGPLVTPLTKTQYLSQDRKTYPIPPKLFSHNDQQSIWQSSSPEGSTIGWGGNLGDLALSSNSSSLFTCISVTGNTVFLSGDTAQQYQVSTSGAVPVKGVKSNIYNSSAASAALRTLMTQSRTDLIESEYNKVNARSILAETQVSAALGSVSITTPFPTGNSLADQLKVVARLIAARGALGTKRQVFLVSLGGFDLHQGMVVNQPILLGKVSAAMTAFYNATVEMGLADKVTAFTASDFGRTLQSNGGGADHGWGSHHFMVGGAVKGAAFYGTAPPVSVGSTTAASDQWHVGQGRLLPSTSVDQYAATLAQWFGVAASELPGILPNLKRFGVQAGRPDYPSNMGFMTGSVA